ncbi:MAG: MBL fold metallo-hydrolase [Alphaproteobacteria bacterium]|nr:MBL fold metallo-hydrolase [Alphaproteobacteria bacterium]MBU2379969.1 MBL fold metallo-hydrolase [Alphaproteobacteria bacterium]
MVGALRLETDLADGVITSEGEASTGSDGLKGLTYPLGAPPAPGQAVQAAPGVLWLRLPLPMQLNHINVYAIEDGDGWAVVDTGIRTPDSVAAWEAALAGPMGGRPVTRVICTHMHPDHIGLAGWLCERFDAPLLMTQLEYVTARMLVADTGPAPESGADFWRAAGWTEDRIERYRQTYGMFAKGVAPLPAGYQRLSEGDVLSIGGHDWTIIVGNGHSPEHACLWRKADGVLISGDQILPRISSNISVWPTEPLADPLHDWLTSLDRLGDILPPETFVLPGHGEPFAGVLPRIEALKRGHAVSLKRLERTLKTPSRAIDVFGALFARPVDGGLLGMATGEAIAHLNYLAGQGRARRDRDADGVDWWTCIQTEIEA